MIPLKDDNPRSSVPIITIGLIVVNVLVFLYELSLGPRIEFFIQEYAAIPAKIVRGRELETLVTSMFLHGGFFHVGSNMLYFWIFGDNVEHYLGHFRFIYFYLICGLFAAITHIFLGGISEVPMIGASGAISGVLGAYLVKYPRAQVLVLIPIFWFITIRKIPALFVLGLWFAMQLLSGVFSGLSSTGLEKGGIAFWAHVGGFVAGMILINIFKRKRRVEWHF
ncbi:MAG: rhomboid family intramembrane serine protease [bacterium]